MKSSQRQTAAAVGFFALLVAGAPALAQRSGQPEQRGGPPKADGTTPYILITTFQSADRKLGVDAGDEVRRRFQSEWSMKDLFVVTKANIDNTLTASGYRPDSALNASDLMELSKQLKGDYVIDGKASKNGTATRLETRVLIRLVQTTLAQPLPVAEGKDVGDAAKQIEKSFGEVFKSMPMYRKCVDGLRAAKNDEAIAAARASIALYQNSTFARICMLNAYVNKKDSPDSVIAVATALSTIDPTNLFALSNLAEAYNAKGDKDKAIEINMRIYRLDPNNQEFVRGLIGMLASSGAPIRALTLLDTLMQNNPGDPGMLRTKWQLQLLAKQFKNAIVTGEEMVKLDTAAANLDYFNRQIGAAQSDSNAAKVIELAAKAGQKFPNDVSFQNLLASNYRKAGQLQQAYTAARRATVIDPKSKDAWLLAVVLATELKMLDSVSAMAPKAIEAGADKAIISQTLAATLQPVVSKAQESKSREDWAAALSAAQAVDAVASSATSKFFVGFSAFNIALDALQGMNDLQKKSQDKNKTVAAEATAKACEEVKVIEDNFATAQINVPAGAGFNREGATQVMTLVGQYSPYIPQFKTAFKCK